MPSRTKCHWAMSSIGAKATIIFLREPWAFLVRASNHLARAILLVLKKAPGELDHPTAHPSIAGSGNPLLAACLSAYVGRPREPSVTRHGAAVGASSCAQHIEGRETIKEHLRKTRCQTGPMRRSKSGNNLERRDCNRRMPASTAIPARRRSSVFHGFSPVFSGPLAGNFQPAAGSFGNKEEFNGTAKLKGNKFANYARPIAGPAWS
jgi:hypothetical protein